MKSITIIPFAVRLSLLTILATLLSLSSLSINFQSLIVLTVLLSAISVVSYVSNGISWNFGSRLLCVFVLIFGIMVVNIIVELLFFASLSLLEVLVIGVSGSLTAIGAALAVTFVFPPGHQTGNMKNDLDHYFSGWHLSQLVIRFGLATLSYLLVYFVVGALAYQFTAPYYVPGNSLGLTVPSVHVVVMAQLVRAPIYIASLFLFIVGCRYSQKTVANLCAALLVIFGGLVPLALNSDWPTTLLLYHALEILLQNGFAGFAMGWLLFRPNL